MKRPVHGGNIAWAATQIGCSPTGILDFSASINPLGPPASAIAAIQAALGTVIAYPDPDYTQLRASLSQAVGIPPEWILPGNGAAELLTWIGRDLSELEATFLVTPGFRDYRRALAAFGANIIEFPLSLSDDRRDAFQLSLTPPSRACGLLLNNPHNPTGQLWQREEILPLLDQFALVVVDEAFMDFLPPTQHQSLLDQVQERSNLVILRSLTKFYSLPGLRLGYVVAHPDRLQRWQAWRDPWPINSLSIAAAIAVLQDRAFEQQTWNWLPPTRQRLFQELSQLHGFKPYPGAANFLLVQTEQNSVQLQQQLLSRHQILIRDCLSFPELGDRFFRVAVRTQAENQRLWNGLNDILTANYDC